MTKDELLAMSGEEFRKLTGGGCSYCVRCVASVGCVGCKGCEGCVRCGDCESCVRCVGCVDCKRCWSCVDCSFCSEQTEKRWMIFNIQLTETEYASVMERLRG